MHPFALQVSPRHGYGVVMVKAISPGTVIVPNRGSVTERRRLTPKSDVLPADGELATTETIEFGRLPSDRVVKVMGLAPK